MVYLIRFDVPKTYFKMNKKIQKPTKKINVLTL